MTSRNLLGMAVLSVAGMLVVSSAQAQCAGCKCGMSAGKETNATATVVATNKTIKLQTNCPVMGEAIDKRIYVDYEGKRVYLCCKGCVAPMTKDPAKYIKKLEDEGVTVAKLQTTCPIMGGAINKDIYVDHDGKRIYLCCKGCVATATKDAAKYIKEMEEGGVALDPAVETSNTGKK